MTAAELGPEVRDAAAQFRINGSLISMAPLQRGIINDTYKLTYQQSLGRRSFVLQRINTRVFPDPHQVMENTVTVTKHLQKKLMANGVTDIERRCLSFHKTGSDQYLYRDDRGDFWRMSTYITASRVLDSPTEALCARAAARVLGTFHAQLFDLPLTAVKEIIPEFHNTEARQKQLVAAIDRDSENRVFHVQKEIARALMCYSTLGTRRHQTHEEGVRLRVVHNDAKIGNVLFDHHAPHALCLVDLDTVGPGHIDTDFGDLLRSVTCPAEAEAHRQKIQVRTATIEAVVRGFFAGAGDTLCKTEKAHLSTAGTRLALELSMRFLADFLNGDKYFRIAHPEHNRHRAQVQLSLMKCLQQEEEMITEIIDKISP